MELKKVMQPKRFLQNEIFVVLYLMIIVNLSPKTMIKFILFVILLVAFNSSLKHLKFVAFMHNLFLILFQIY